MRILIMLAVVALLQSCSIDELPQKEYNYERSRVYQKSYNEICNKINEWLSKNKEYIRLTDKEQDLVHIEMNIPDPLVYKYSDYIPANDSWKEYHNVIGTIDIMMKPFDNYTDLEIIASFCGILERKIVGFEGQYSETEPVKHSSTGILEKEILDFISK